MLQAAYCSTGASVEDRRLDAEKFAHRQAEDDVITETEAEETPEVEESRYFAFQG